MAAEGGQSSPPPPPIDWPEKADADYDRLRILGRGAFGQVLLCRGRESGELVAVKGVSIESETEGATAAREMAILSELRHPNVIRMLHGYEPASPGARGRYMALSYVEGPDLGDVLEHGGALSLGVAQLVARDLISAVAYCHVRGVMHRDIKPDNIMLTGLRVGRAWKSEDYIWDDEPFTGCKPKAILVDFGFARATSREDYEDDEPAKAKGGLSPKTGSLSSSLPPRPQAGKGLSRAKSRVMFRAKSALGTQHFLAPEIASNARRRDSKLGDEALTAVVSSYGLISDAYAIGATISEIVTGVPPGSDNEAYVAANRREAVDEPPSRSESVMTRRRSSLLSPLTMIKQRMGRRHSMPEPVKEPRKISLRYTAELPDEVDDLIEAMKEEDVNIRMSVREAQDHKWIGGYDKLEHGDVPSQPDDPMVYLGNKDAFI